MLRRLIYEVEEALGTALGTVLRVLPTFGWLFYRFLVSLNRLLPDRLTLWLDEFMTSFGNALLDMRGAREARTIVASGVHMILDVSEKTQRQIFSKKIFEAGLTRYLLRQLQLGDTMVDVGANVGYFSMVAAAMVGNRGKVIAVEPEAANLAALRRNIKENNFTHVRVVAAAAGDTEASMELHVNPLNRGGNSLHTFTDYKAGAVHVSKEEAEKRFGREALTQTVLVHTLDSLLEDELAQGIRFMKIDVEGFEDEVLQGATAVLASGAVEAVICELGRQETRGSLMALFGQYGYSPFTLTFVGTPEPVSQDTKDRDILFIRNVGRNNVV